MNDFITHYGVCVLLCAIGLFFVIMTYASFFIKPSGTPLIGGIFIALGFLTTPYKWLALLGLIDPGYLMLLYSLIQEHIIGRRFEAVYVQHEFLEGERDDSESIHIHISDRNKEVDKKITPMKELGFDAHDPLGKPNEETPIDVTIIVPRSHQIVKCYEKKLLLPYVTRHIYPLNIPKLLFSVCKDKAGKRYILIDRCIKGGQIEVLAFDEGRIVLNGKASGSAEMNAEVEIVKNEISQ